MWDLKKILSFFVAETWASPILTKPCRIFVAEVKTLIVYSFNGRMFQMPWDSSCQKYFHQRKTLEKLCTICCFSDWSSMKKLCALLGSLLSSLRLLTWMKTLSISPVFLPGWMFSVCCGTQRRERKKGKRRQNSFWINKLRKLISSFFLLMLLNLPTLCCNYDYFVAWKQINLPKFNLKYLFVYFIY